MTARYVPKHFLESPGPPWLSSRSRQSRETAKEASFEPGSALSQGKARKRTTGPGTAPDVPVGAAAARRTCAGHLLRGTLVALFIAPFIALNPAAGLAQTFGIDCDQPRRNGDGKLILSDDGSQRAGCEADRATALNYATVVRETRDRLRSALAGVPPPLWDDLVEHLRTRDDINSWTYDDDAVLDQLKILSDGAPPPDDPSEIATMKRAYDRAASRAPGLLGGTSYPAEWRGIVKARACGVGADGTLAPGATVLVWLERDAIRDRWTPEMVQRTVQAWVQRTEGRNRLVDRIPDIVTTTGQLKRYDGSLRPNMPAACLGVAPEGALALRVTVRRNIDTGRRTERCTDPGQVGSRKLMWARHNGVFIVPETAIIDPPGDMDGDGRHDPHPDQGDPLLDPPVTDEAVAAVLIGTTCRAPRTLDAVRADPCDAEISGTPVKGTHVRRFRFREVQNDPDAPFRINMVPVRPGNGERGITQQKDRDAGTQGAHWNDGHPLWEETTLFCEGELPDSDAPDIPEPVVDPDRDVPDCRAAHGGRFNEGSRTGYVQTITYPDGWPVDDVEIRRIDDDCFRQVEQTGAETREIACPAGHSGRLIERRSFRWYNRDWAVPTRHNNGAEGNRTFVQALAAWKADPAQAGKKWYDTVVRVRDWHLDRLTCKAPRQVSDTQTRSGTCPAEEVGFTTEARTLNWYNRDPGATPPHVITDREVEEAAAAYDATPSQAGLAWYRKVTATPWAAVRRFCSVSPSPSNPSARTCDNTCAERGGIAGRNSGGEYCQSPKLPKCSGSGGNGGNTGDDREGREDHDRDGENDDTDPDDGDASVQSSNRNHGNNNDEDNKS